MRWDGGIEIGSEIALFYDPMLAKLIVWAPTRDAAIARMHRALLELTIEGVETSRDFHLRVMEDAEFRAGAIEIQWLERRLPSIARRAARRRTRARLRAAIAAALLAERDRANADAQRRPHRATATAKLDGVEARGARRTGCDERALTRRRST